MTLLSSEGAAREAASHLTTPGAHVKITNVTKMYGQNAAVDHVSLDITPGQFVTLLGASGSGKTTLLRIIAGFNDASSGTIEIDGKEVSRIPVYKRNIGMVFQNYALFPHMTVEKNVAFPLARRRVPRAERGAMIADALAAVELTGFEKRLPRELSGGQQQRVALARAIVARPRLLLMDEPLGALDRRLREALQIQIRQLSLELGLTVINVTHDQEEALTMSDRIALLSSGRLTQYGTPQELYAAPESEIVAQFLGESNIFKGVVSEGKLDLPDSSISVPSGPGGEAVAGSRASVLVRPHVIRLTDATVQTDPSLSSISATVTAVIYAGDSAKVLATGAHGEELVVRCDPALAASVLSGDAVTLSWQTESSLLLQN